MTETNITDEKIWVGLSNLTLANAAPSLSIQTYSASNFVAVNYMHLFNGGNWSCCSANGTFLNCTDTKVTVAANTEYMIDLNWTVAGKLECTINGVKTTKTDTLSTMNVGLGIYNAAPPLVAQKKRHLIAKGMLEQN